MSSGMGRPKVENPKCNDVKVRLDDLTHEKLLKYCKEHQQTKAEVIREAIVSTVEKNK